MLGAHCRERARKLHREILRHRVQESRVVVTQLVRVTPPHLKKGDHALAKPHGNQDEAGKRRQLLRSHLYCRARLLEHDASRRKVATSELLARWWRNTQPHRRPLASGKLNELVIVGHKRRQRRILQRLRLATHAIARAFGNVGKRRPRIHGLGYLLKHAAEERSHVQRVQRTQNDAQRAREPPVGA